MRDFVIITETTTDLPASYIEENGLVIAPLYYQIEETVYGEEKHLEPKEFFDAMRNGAAPTTSASNPDTVRKKYIEIIESGKDILHLAFSSGLSCSYNNAAFVANEQDRTSNAGRPYERPRRRTEAGHCARYVAHRL